MGLGAAPADTTPLVTPVPVACVVNPGVLIVTTCLRIPRSRTNAEWVGLVHAIVIALALTQ